MAGQGRRPDHKRRQEAAELRAEGLTYTEIAERLGATKHDVYALLKKSGMWQPPPGICCRVCSKQIRPAGRGINYRIRPLCLACLAKHPDASFGERLKAFRMAAGLTLKVLGQRLGRDHQALAGYESGTCSPKWSRLVLLIRVFGAGSVTLGLEGKPKGWRKD
jgi:transcriptional regulator with XRE-family HTH domain